MTGLGKKAYAGQKGEDMKKQIPTGSFALQEEIGAEAAFPTSNSSEIINGADLLIDGGFTV